MAQHDYNNTVHEEIETTCHLGEELHVVTSNAFNSRVLNLRMFRVVPSKTGHTGYTRIGFFLTKKEARNLRDALSEVIEDENAWDTDIPEALIDMEDDVE
tara:strand:- start:182 stop:481 length:300 start_codon:yes stop_codon:yes gene_type:complete